jgi:hypothetical protein
MLYTYGRLKRAVEHAIAALPDTGGNTRLTSGQIVNNAISYLVTFASWTWRRRAAELDVVSGQTYIDLPTDFAELIDVQPAGPTYGTPTTGTQLAGVRRVSEAEHDGLIRTQWDPKGFLGYVLGTRARTSFTSTVSTYVLFLAPIPSASYTAGLRVSYRIGPNSYAYDVTDTSDDSKIVDVPEPWHNALYFLCRALAVSSEDERVGQDWAEADKLLAKLLETDVRTQGSSNDTLAAGGGFRPYSVMQLTSEVRAVAGNKADAINPIRVINDAIAWVHNSYDWSWRVANTTITMPDNNTDPDPTLPVDCEAVDSVLVPQQTVWTNAYPNELRAVTPTEILNKRSQNGMSGQLYGGYDIYAVMASGLTVDATASGIQNEVANYRLAVWPRRQSITYTVQYRRQPKFIYVSTDQPATPAWIHPLIRQAVRLLALQYIGKDTEKDRAFFEADLKAAQARDDSTQPIAGRLRRNVGEVRRVFVGTISPPP